MSLGGALVVDGFRANLPWSTFVEVSPSASRGHFKHLYIAWGASADDAETQCSPYIRKSRRFSFWNSQKYRTHGLCHRVLSGKEWACVTSRREGHVLSTALTSGWLLFPSTFPLSFPTEGRGWGSDLTLQSGAAEHRIRLPTSREGRNHRSSIRCTLGPSGFGRSQDAWFSPSHLEPWKRREPRLLLGKLTSMRLCSKRKKNTAFLFLPV